MMKKGQWGADGSSQRRTFTGSRDVRPDSRSLVATDEDPCIWNMVCLIEREVDILYQLLFRLHANPPRDINV